MDFITSSAELNFQEVESIYICFVLLLDRIKTFLDKVQIPVDKLETQYLRKFHVALHPNILLSQLTKQYFQSPNQIVEDATAQNSLNKRYGTVIKIKSL